MTSTPKLHPSPSRASSPGKGRLSDNWIGTRFYCPDFRPIIEKAVSELNLLELRTQANKLRRREDCVVEKHFSCGKDHVVFELTFGDDTTWIARLPLFLDENQIAQHKNPQMQNEIATLRFIGRHSHIPVPAVLGWNLDEKNKVGAPYMFMSAIFGRAIQPLPIVELTIRPHVYQQVAKLMIQLSQLPRWQQIGQIHESNEEYTIKGMSFGGPISVCIDPVGSAEEYYEKRAQMFLDVMLSTNDAQKIALAWLYRDAIPRLINTEFPSDGFPLRHADFSNCNFLFDQDNNISGVLDWTGAQSAPWELFSIYPHELRRLFPHDPRFSESRALFLSIFEQEESKVDPDVPMAKFMGSTKARVAELVQNYQFMGGNVGISTEEISELIPLVYGEERKWGDLWEELVTKVKATYRLA